MFEVLDDGTTSSLLRIFLLETTSRMSKTCSDVILEIGCAGSTEHYILVFDCYFELTMPMIDGLNGKRSIALTEF